MSVALFIFHHVKKIDFNICPVAISRAREIKNMFSRGCLLVSCRSLLLKSEPQQQKRFNIAEEENQ